MAGQNPSRDIVTHGGESYYRHKFKLLLSSIWMGGGMVAILKLYAHHDLLGIGRLQTRFINSWYWTYGTVFGRCLKAPFLQFNKLSWSC